MARDYASSIAMNTRSFARAASGALVCAALVLTTVLRSAESDLGVLRSKAENGNAIAQYNLGLAYLEGRLVPKDTIEAFVWLTLAAENGATGKALKSLTPDLSPEQIVTAQERLADRRSLVSSRLLAQSSAAATGATISVPAHSSAPAGDPQVPPVVASAAPAADTVQLEALQKETASLHADNARLSVEVASAWKELEAAKASQTEAAQRAEKAELALRQSDKETAALYDERDQLRVRLDAASTALKSLPPASARTDQEKALAAARDAQAKSAADLEKARRDLAAAQAASTGFEARIKKLSEENTALTAKLKQGRDSDRDAATVRAQAARDAAEVKTLRARIGELSAANQRLETQAGSLADAGRRLNESQASVARLQKELADLKAKPAPAVDASALQLAQANIARLEKEVADLKAVKPAPAPVDTSALELAQAKQELARAKQTVDMTVRSYTLAKQENERLKAQVEKVQQVLAGLRDATAAAPAAH